MEPTDREFPREPAMLAHGPICSSNPARHDRTAARPQQRAAHPPGGSGCPGSAPTASSPSSGNPRARGSPGTAGTASRAASGRRTPPPTPATGCRGRTPSWSSPPDSRARDRVAEWGQRRVSGGRQVAFSDTGSGSGTSTLAVTSAVQATGRRGQASCRDQVSPPAAPVQGGLGRAQRFGSDVAARRIDASTPVHLDERALSTGKLTIQKAVCRVFMRSPTPEQCRPFAQCSAMIIGWHGVPSRCTQC